MKTPLPTLFVSHGAPTLLIDPGPTRDFLKELGETLGRPRGILCVSAHWEASTPTVTLGPNPKTIHDFFGFPPELYEVSYPAPGDRQLAQGIIEMLKADGFAGKEDSERGLDHGAWVPLKLMFPEADVPVVQLSVQSGLGADHHLRMGKALQPLRKAGVLILGSGGATHNLREFQGQAIDVPPPDYVKDFETWLCQAVTEGREDALINYQINGPSARRNHPTPEHFLPLFVPLGAAGGAQGRLLHRAFTYGILSMAAFAWD
ncbi:MAG: dioxygenase [Acidobacteriia bacterium]|nr:dioxygenase [Terriglobia bacterium]